MGEETFLNMNLSTSVRVNVSTRKPSYGQFCSFLAVFRLSIHILTNAKLYTTENM